MVNLPPGRSTQALGLLNRYTDLKLLGQIAAALLILPFLPLLLPALITGFLFLAPIKVYLKFTCGMNRSKKRLDGKTALVTGGSKGERTCRRLDP